MIVPSFSSASICPLIGKVPVDGVAKLTLPAEEESKAFPWR